MIRYRRFARLWERISEGVCRRLSPSGRGKLLSCLEPEGVGAEVGVWRGDFSLRLLTAAQPEELHLIDPWEFAEEDEYINSLQGGRVARSQSEMDALYAYVSCRFDNDSEVEIHRGRSGTVLETFDDNYFDWLYIDGDHSYNAVQHDIELALQKVKVGGLIGGDDYNMPNTWWKDGVTKAVDEVIEEGRVWPLAFGGHQWLVENTDCVDCRRSYVQ